VKHNWSETIACLSWSSRKLPADDLQLGEQWGKIHWHSSELISVLDEQLNMKNGSETQAIKLIITNILIMNEASIPYWYM